MFTSSPGCAEGKFSENICQDRNHQAPRDTETRHSQSGPAQQKMSLFVGTHRVNEGLPPDISLHKVLIKSLDVNITTPGLRRPPIFMTPPRENLPDFYDILQCDHHTTSEHSYVLYLYDRGVVLGIKNQVV